MTISLACLIAFCAGFVDAIAGGGGLIQVPGLLLLFPNVPIATLLGTNKLAASCGTAIASYHYARRLDLDYQVLLPTLIITFILASCGAKVVMLFNNANLKPVVLLLLVFIGIYTLVKQKLGLQSQRRFHDWRLLGCCLLIGAIMGFYDGFFGPGTGSILLFLLVSGLGYSFLEGAAMAKLINLAANLAAVLIFISHQHVMYKLALPMAACNVLGNSIGARCAIQRGSGFVRWIFLGVILLMLSELIKALH